MLNVCVAFGVVLIRCSWSDIEHTYVLGVLSSSEMSDHLKCLVWCFHSGLTTRQFVGHTKDVLSVAFSADNRQIVSGSRDKTIKLWNTLGVCKYTIQVSCQLMSVE